MTFSDKPIKESLQCSQSDIDCHFRVAFIKALGDPASKVASY